MCVLYYTARGLSASCMAFASSFRHSPTTVGTIRKGTFMIYTYVNHMHAVVYQVYLYRKSKKRLLASHRPNPRLTVVVVVVVVMPHCACYSLAHETEGATCVPARGIHLWMYDHASTYPILKTNMANGARATSAPGYNQPWF